MYLSIVLMYQKCKIIYLNIKWFLEVKIYQIFLFHLCNDTVNKNINVDLKLHLLEIYN